MPTLNLTPSTSTQQALANDPDFRNRFMSNLVQAAFTVVGEDPATTGHAARLAFAQKVITNPATYAAQLAAYIVMRTNLMSAVNTVLTINIVNGNVVHQVDTSAADAAIQSQLATDWSTLAGA